MPLPRPIRVGIAAYEGVSLLDRIDAIAQRCGFTNEEQLRRAFARHLGIPPRAYRARFAAA